MLDRSSTSKAALRLLIVFSIRLREVKKIHGKKHEASILLFLEPTPRGHTASSVPYHSRILTEAIDEAVRKTGTLFFMFSRTSTDRNMIAVFICLEPHAMSPSPCFFNLVILKIVGRRSHRKKHKIHCEHFFLRATPH
jgi:hypothetical protein